MKTRLEKLKKKLCMEWGELAQHLKMSRSMLDKIRTGLRDPGPHTERVILEAEIAAGLVPREQLDVALHVPIPGEIAAAAFQSSEKEKRIRAAIADLRAQLNLLEKLLNEK